MKLLKRIKQKKSETSLHKKWYIHDQKFVSHLDLPLLSESETQKIMSVWPCFDWRNEDYLSYKAYKKLNGFSPYFIGGYQSSFIWKCLNPRELSSSLSNKAYMDFIYPHIPFPKTILRGITGNIYDADMNFLTLQEGIKLLSGFEEFIIKPSVGRSYGSGVMKVSLSQACDHAKMAIEETIRDVGDNFVVQEVLHQHPIMANLNPTSVNSCRFTSIYIDGQYDYSVILKIGKMGSHIDNWRNGYVLGVSNQGIINEIGYDISLNQVKETDTRVKFGGMKVPGFEKMAEIVEYSHKKYLPMCGVIGWDMMVDTEGEPHVIEFNLRPDFFAEQLCSGTFFEPFSKTICKKIWY